MILVSSLHRLTEIAQPYVFTNKHAYVQGAQFFSELADLQVIDWEILQRRDFTRDHEDPDKITRYMAEALVHRHLPVASLLGMACFDAAAETRIQCELAKRDLNLKLVVNSDYYF